MSSTVSRMNESSVQNPFDVIHRRRYTPNKQSILGEKLRRYKDEKIQSDTFHKTMSRFYIVVNEAHKKPKNAEKAKNHWCKEWIFCDFGLAVNELMK